MSTIEKKLAAVCAYHDLTCVAVSWQEQPYYKKCCVWVHRGDLIAPGFGGAFEEALTDALAEFAKRYPELQEDAA